MIRELKEELEMLRSQSSLISAWMLGFSLTLTTFSSRGRRPCCRRRRSPGRVVLRQLHPVSASIYFIRPRCALTPIDLSVLARRPEKQMVTYQTKTGELRTVSKADLQDQMQASEKIMQSLNETWESKMEKTETARREREQALEELGISVEKGALGVSQHSPLSFSKDCNSPLPVVSASPLRSIRQRRCPISSTWSVVRS